MNRLISLTIITLAMSLLLAGCFSRGLRNIKLNQVISVTIATEPEKAKVSWYIESQTDDVKSTTPFYLGHSPYRETKKFKIPGLSRRNIDDVYLVIYVDKAGYFPVIERFNLASVYMEGKISKMYILHPEDQSSKVEVKKPRTVTRKATNTNTNTSQKRSVLKYTNPYQAKVQPTAKKVETSARVMIKTVPKTVTDVFEPNDTIDKAKSIYLNRDYVAKMDNSTDIDHYMIFLGARPMYQLKLDQLPSEAKYKVEIFSYPKKSEAIYQLVTNGSEGLLEFRLADKGLKTGIYRVKVSYVSGSTGVYRLRLSVKK